MHIVNYMDTMIHVFDCIWQIAFGKRMGLEIVLKSTSPMKLRNILFDDFQRPGGANPPGVDTVARAGWLRACKPTRTWRDSDWDVGTTKRRQQL
jgi:hypothetical protein